MTSSSRATQRLDMVAELRVCLPGITVVDVLIGPGRACFGRAALSGSEGFPGSSGMSGRGKMLSTQMLAKSSKILSPTSSQTAREYLITEHFLWRGGPRKCLSVGWAGSRPTDRSRTGILFRSLSLVASSLCFFTGGSWCRSAAGEGPQTSSLPKEEGDPLPPGRASGVSPFVLRARSGRCSIRIASPPLARHQNAVVFYHPDPPPCGGYHRRSTRVREPS